jgi:alpha-methylacyl-CoA racemase
MTATPLAGVRVLDLTRLLPGNYCCWLLGALGADVLKIEDPGNGDYMRSFGIQVDGQGSTHQLVNRGKRSAVVSLKHEEGVEVFRRLVAEADVVVSSFRPGVLERLGLGYAELSRIRPSLVHAEISSFGGDSPLAAVAAHDLNCVAVSGLLERLGPADSAPVIPPVPLSDVVGGGLTPALGIVALVLAARTTGQGAHLDASLAEGLSLLPNLVVADILAGGEMPGRSANDFDGGLACYDVYAVRDGCVSVGAVEQPFWRALCNDLGVPELVEIQNDPSRQDEIRARLGAALAPFTRDELDARFAGRDVCVLPVRSYEEMLEHPQSAARGLVRRDPLLPMPVLAPPFVIDGVRPPESRPAPRQGEHTLEVLQELGLEGDEIERLFDGGAVGLARDRVA